MARIDMTLDMTRAVEVTDDPVGANSYEGADWLERGLRYAWLTIPGVGGDTLMLHLANGLATDAQIVDVTDSLIATLGNLRAAARARLAAQDARETELRLLAGYR